MENLDLLRTLIKKYGGNTPKPDKKKELYKTVLYTYSKREPMTNEEKEYLGTLAWQMINNFYPENNHSTDM